MSGPTVGMEAYAPVICEPKEIPNIAQDMCIDYIGSYGFDFDPEGDDDYETVTSELDYYYEEYCPDKHDMYRAGGGSFADDFKLMEQRR